MPVGDGARPMAAAVEAEEREREERERGKRRGIRERTGETPVANSPRAKRCERGKVSGRVENDEGREEPAVGGGRD